jgi:hypothetical protein
MVVVVNPFFGSCTSFEFADKADEMVFMQSANGLLEELEETFRVLNFPSGASCDGVFSGGNWVDPSVEGTVIKLSK